MRSIKTFKTELTTFHKPLILVIMLAFASLNTACRRETMFEEDIVNPAVKKGKFEVNTDFSYYVIEYKYGALKTPIKQTMRNQKHWEKEFDVNPGDTLIFDVQAIKSNIPGTMITANIFVDGKLLDSNRKTTECEDGTCPIELAPGLQMKKVIE